MNVGISLLPTVNGTGIIIDLARQVVKENSLPMILGEHPME
jgi:hypothetical protein